MLRSKIGNWLLELDCFRLCRGFAASTGDVPGTNPRQSRGLTRVVVGIACGKNRAFTLVEMLVAMAITLVMMGAVVTLFANLSNSVRNRRATTEMSGQLRHVRNVLQQDLQGATCPGVTWQRPESNHGYIEIIEGPYREGYASKLIDGVDLPGRPDFNPEIDHAISILPSSNLPFTTVPGQSNWATDGGGLGDYDDILMLTVRNEREPFVGRIPAGLNASRGFIDWGSETIQSPLAEVVWFAIENPAPSENVNNFFGEPGMRTIYRRKFLIAPWVNPYLPYANASTGLANQDSFQFKPVPGLVRLLPSNTTLEEAIAAMIAFQDRYDLSVRLEWDYNLDSPNGRWKIMANTLSDLTKRENRFGHFYYRPVKSGAREVGREYPFALISTGSGYSGNSVNMQFVTDPDPGMSPAAPANSTANLTGGAVVSYAITLPGSGYPVRPFVYANAESTTVATAQAMLDDNGSVVRLIFGPAPLWGTRRGEDVMMTDALAFDLRVYDPGAPMFATIRTPATSSTPVELDVVLTPSDPGWLDAYMHNDHMRPNGTGTIGSNNTSNTVTYPYVGQGAYVDLGYGFNSRFSPPGLPTPAYTSAFASAAASWFFEARALSDVYLDSRPANQKPWSQLAPGYAVYDTWSFHYENNGVNEDQLRSDGSGWPAVDDAIDEGTNGLDDNGNYADAWNVVRLGVDDVGERETAPPYDKPLRGMQALIRAYERDSRAIRQVRVNQHFMQE